MSALGHLRWLTVGLVLSASVVACQAEPDEEEGGAESALKASDRGNDLASIADNAKETGDIPGVPFVPASKGGQDGERQDTVKFVVIHDIEGTGLSAVETFRESRAVTSAHYVIDKFGVAVQMVREGTIAKHSGSLYFNGTAVGVEHAGFAASGGYTSAEYAASIKLVASIVSRYKIPIDREHIISHSQVPSSEDTMKACVPAATNCGGRNHHDDPGPHWDWTGYLAGLKTAVAALPATKNSSSSGGQASTTTPSKSSDTNAGTSSGTTTGSGTDTSTSTGDASQATSSTGGATCASDGTCNPGNDGSGLICVGGRCVPGCRSNAQCPGTTTCSAGQCR